MRDDVAAKMFGEFVGPRGELASYAFGWTTGSEPHVAALSIGIGAGNPGGGNDCTSHRRQNSGQTRVLNRDADGSVPVAIIDHRWC